MAATHKRIGRYCSVAVTASVDAAGFPFASSPEAFFLHSDATCPWSNVQAPSAFTTIKMAPGSMRTVPSYAPMSLTSRSLPSEHLAENDHPSDDHKHFLNQRPRRPPRLHIALPLKQML